jgi:hypothetical protein
MGLLGAKQCELISASYRATFRESTLVTFAHLLTQGTSTLTVLLVPARYDAALEAQLSG